MDALSIEQKQRLYHICEYLTRQLDGQPATPAALAQVLPFVYPAADIHAAETYLTRVQAGGEQFRQAYTACASDEGMPQPAQVADYLTRGLEAPQRKGLFLQSYEFLRQYHAACGIDEAKTADGPPQLAMLDEEELKKLFTEQLTILSEELAPAFGEASGALSDPLGYAAAIYVAAGNGDLPAYYIRSPEMLGACLAANQTLAALPDEARQQSAVSIVAVLAGVTIAILVAVLVVPAILPAAAAADAALAGALQNLTAALPAIMADSGGFYLLRLLIGLVGGLGTASVLLSPLAAGALTYVAADRIRRFYRERTAQHPAASAPSQPASQPHGFETSKESEPQKA